MNTNEVDSLNLNEENHEIYVIKRSGERQKYDPEKLRKVCMWACDDNEYFCNTLIESLKIKMYNDISIVDMFDELIKTAVNNINRINPQYETIAAKLYLKKMYFDSWTIKTIKEYPDYYELVKRGIDKKVYTEKVFYSFTKEELREIGTYIKPEHDYLFTYKSLYTFYSKYCLNYSKERKLELPQHAYMRIALTLFHKEKPEVRLQYIKKFYNYLSQHFFTLATPIMLNSGTMKQQLSSCVLSKMGDSATSIMDTIKDIAIYSKFKGGNAVDISEIRASGSYILGNNGFSSGPVPFLKIIESTIKAFNQGATRPGVCCVYFQWWHQNFEELVVLKSNSGTEENRARHLKYAVKINDLLLDRVLKNQNVSLFNPHDVPKLIGVYGKAFEQQYIEYEEDLSIKRKTIEARKVMQMILKERVETGNIYLFHEENVNQTTMLNRYINSSNLCCEIVLPSRESKLITEDVERRFHDEKINKIYEAGEISLCNLASINLAKWGFQPRRIQEEIIDIVVRGMDNTIDIADYPVQEGAITNKKYRYLGIGVLNFANYLALRKVCIDDNESLEMSQRLFEVWSYMVISASLKLAKEKGKYEMFDESKWKQGSLPIFVANKKALALTKNQPNYDRWYKLSEEIKKYGLRNAQLMAIAPTATSGKAINATESIEPIQHFFYKEDGKINLPTLAPNIKKNAKYYKTAVECNQYTLLKHAAIRQCYLDQAQSINSYFKKVTSLTDFTLYHIFGFNLGIKTYYYCKTEKDVVEEVCESCT